MSDSTNQKIVRVLYTIPDYLFSSMESYIKPDILTALQCEIEKVLRPEIEFLCPDAEIEFTRGPQLFCETTPRDRDLENEIYRATNLRLQSETDHISERFREIFAEHGADAISSLLMTNYDPDTMN